MKGFYKKLLYIFAFIFFSQQLFADNLQLVMPKIIYVGDTVEIRYVFHTDAILFGDNFSSSSSTIMDLRTDYDLFLSLKNDFALRSATLQKINSEYTLQLTVTPWKTGFLAIPPFNLTNMVNFTYEKNLSKNQRLSTVPYIVNLSPVEVKSLVAKTKNSSFMPQSSPLILPGTTILLVFLSIAAIIFFGFLIFCFLRLPLIKRFIENITYLHSIRKNSRKSIKKLLRLQKDSKNINSDKNYAEKIQKILRDFLNKRFDGDFSSVTTEKLYDKFIQLFGGKMGNHQENTINTLLEIFIRLEYIRFSENGAFLTEKENSGTMERDSIIEKAIRLIEAFDQDEDSEGSDDSI